MTDNNKIHKRFLEEQVLWCKKQDLILEKIEIKLYEMRGIAEYATEEELSSREISRLNNQLDELKSEIKLLEQKLEVIVH